MTNISVMGLFLQHLSKTASETTRLMPQTTLEWQRLWLGGQRQYVSCQSWCRGGNSAPDWPGTGSPTQGVGPHGAKGLNEGPGSDCCLRPCLLWVCTWEPRLVAIGVFFSAVFLPSPLNPLSMKLFG